MTNSPVSLTWVAQSGERLTISFNPSLEKIVVTVDGKPFFSATPDRFRNFISTLEQMINSLEPNDTTVQQSNKISLSRRELKI